MNEIIDKYHYIEGVNVISVKWTIHGPNSNIVQGT